MMSKISFSKMTLSDMKRRIWMPAVVGFLLLMLMPVVTLVLINGDLDAVAKHMITQKQMMQKLTSWVRMNGPATAIALITAIVSAFSGFRYLYAGKKVDVFHSIPVKREKIFLSQYISGVIMFIAPFLICEALMLLVCGAKGVMTVALSVAALKGMVVMFISYLLFYNVTIFVIMLTGKMLVGFFGMVTLGTYFPALYVVLLGYCQLFLESFYEGPTENLVSSWIPYLSPVTLFAGMQTRGDIFGNAEETSRSLLIIFMAISIAIILLTFVLSFLLYRRRGSEAAGKSMAFARSKPVIKVMLMVLFGLGSGLFFAYFGNRVSMWLFFGVVLGLLVSQFLIEIIYAFDVKQLLAHKKSFGVAVIGTIGITLIFGLDVLGYDRFEAKQDQLEVLEISRGSFDHRYSTQEGFSDIDFKDVPEIYELIRKSKETMKEYSDISDMYDDMYDSETNKTASFSVHYKMKNGSDRYRTYWVDMSKAEKELESLYAQESFKKAQYSIFDINSKEIKNVRVTDYNGEIFINASVEETRKLTEALRKDILSLSYQDIMTSAPFGELGFDYPSGSSAMNYMYDRTEYYPLYASYKNTLKQLENMNYRIKSEITLEDITEIKVDQYDAWSQTENEVSDAAKTYTDPEQLKEIMKGSLNDVASDAYQIDEDLIIIAYYQDDLGNEQQEHYRFKQGEVPDYIEQDFGK